MIKNIVLDSFFFVFLITTLDTKVGPNPKLYLNYFKHLFIYTDLSLDLKKYTFLIIDALLHIYQF